MYKESVPIYWVLGIAAGYLALLAVTLFVVRPRSTSLRPRKVAESLGLPLTPEFELLITSAQRRETRATYLSLGGGILLASLGLIVAHVSDPAQMFWIDFTVTLAAAGVATVIATIAHEGDRQKSEVRIARLRAVTISDYRTPFDQWAPRIVILMAIGALAVRTLLARGGATGVPLLVYGYLALTVISLVIAEIGSRAVVRTGQPAGSVLELAWDDALKSRTLATLAVAPFYLGAYFGIATVTLYPQHSTGLTQGGVLTQLGVTVVAMVLLIISAAQSVGNKQRFLRRLWPQLVPVARTGASQAAAAPQS